MIPTFLPAVWFDQCLLAQAVSPIKSMKGVVEKNDYGNPYFIIAFCVVIVLVVAGTAAAYIMYMRKLKRDRNNPWRLFQQIAKANQFGFRDRRLLAKLAKNRNLEDPCQLMMDSNLWMLDVGREPELCKPKCRKRIQRMYRLAFVEATG